MHQKQLFLSRINPNYCVSDNNYYSTVFPSAITECIVITEHHSQRDFSFINQHQKRMRGFLEKWNQHKISSSYDILDHNKINNMHLENRTNSNLYRLFHLTNLFFPCPVKQPLVCTQVALPKLASCQKFGYHWGNLPLSPGNTGVKFTVNQTPDKRNTKQALGEWGGFPAIKLQSII